MSGTMPPALLVLALGFAPSAAPAQVAPPAEAPPAVQGLPPQPLPALAGSGPALVRDENLVTFDPAQVELRRFDGRWVLAHGPTVLKDFGRREEEARQAWHLIRDLRLSQLGTLGGSQAVMEYWLSNGQPPDRLPRGVRTLALDPEALQVEKAHGHWLLREPGRVLCNFGVHEQEARQALAVVRKYGFNQVGVVGQGVPAMLVFAVGPDRPTQRLAAGDDGSRLAQASAELPPVPAVPSAGGATTPVPTSALPPLRPAGLAGRGGVPGPDLVRRGTNRWQSNWTAQPAVDNVAVERVPFDWRRVQVVRQNGDWKLVVGSHTLGSFGAAERDARLAHAAICHFRATEQVHVGVPERVASYFLSGGQAPRGLMVGLFSERFQPERVCVRELAGRYYLANDNHPIYECGPHADEARYLLQFIQMQRVDHLCRIGPPDRPGLMFLVRSH
jgi:hypothetical protein